MPQIIPEIRKQRFSDQLLEGLSRGATEASTEIPRFFGEKLMQAEQAKRRAIEDEQISKLVGEDVGDIQDPKMRQMIVQQLLQQKQKGTQNIAPLQAGLSTIQRMRELGKGGRLGIGSSLRSKFGGETAKEFGEYEQLGKSLIQLATSIPIRNRVEFETLAAKLYDPSIGDKKREGILNAMEHIISQGMRGSSEEIMQEPKERPSLESFHR